MKALIYTATAFFTGLACLLGFYALQAPLDVRAAKVVLSIDASKMPRVADDQSEPPLYAEEEKTAVGTEDVVRETPPEAETASEAVSTATEEDTAKAGQPSPEPANTEPEQREAFSLPGTVLGGGEEAEPAQEERSATSQPEETQQAAAPQQEATSQPENAAPPEETAQAEEAAQPEETRQAEETSQPEEASQPDETQQVAAAPEIQEQAPREAPVREVPVATNLSTIEDPLEPSQQEQAEKETSSQAPPPAAESLQEAAEKPVPPPLPARRPANIPPPVKVAAIDGASGSAGAHGWAGRQIPTTEAITTNQARVALLLRGIGQDQRDTADAIAKLPPAVSLGVVPVGDGVVEWAAKARAAGHEVIVQLPLEPSDYPTSNPGPDTLLTTAPPQENARRLKSLLARFQGYTGVTNYMGNKLLRSRTALKPILAEIKARNLVYIGAGNSSHAVARELAQELKMRYGNVSIILDIQPTPDGVKKALDRLVRTAQKYGGAIGMARASATTIEQIQLWSETLAARGVMLVPAGTLAQAL